ncbi:Oil body-associated protein 1A [Fulvia fulva]|uniref:Oil body-associated protein 1A n=1 Tax=Passalora fulva TaxID=5499 RepID=A0A9Q8L9C4_PASFU|nr:Oil body-associated protein 1A [Fulvia fulva]KAK4632014.1 Oil body-associated protein 1A [Fulvia fulva]KAK4633326.1 Oil body-associated protein 1A [Fulvia fulva]UJO13166.1 Oil body-associated protein 1A [Fulvia fulva]WPV10670.1 Oil body-associated protein 1A [Fulvia fulva]WPV26442.1 Oil body-associated protein 1A [Fulvia fulva]
MTSKRRVFQCSCCSPSLVHLLVILGSFYIYYKDQLADTAPSIHTTTSTNTKMDAIPVSNEAKGEPESLTNKTLETGAAMVQSFDPPKRLCAHFNAFHVYVNEPSRVSEANHYCAHVNDEVRQCLLYDSPLPTAKLIGVEYMVSERIFNELDPGEQKLWHSHVFEVKSGMLIMPTPPGVPQSAWEIAENKEMEQVVHLYGKVYNLWQTDRGDKVPLGQPQLMTSFTAKDHFDFDKYVGDRDRRFGVDSKHKAEVRAYIEEPKTHPNADALWNGKA